ncbi:tRNA pseudouridine synthase A-like [Thrips palmi]|uniref:Pseudouridylate synthase 1 homolog n=1 Tax=Thrips palmi TaxID=161013 RepID=A0A6P8YBP3_THRPL|nr:tRNA pseudouridine synthase A-like [Thrips palmi]XP_034233680.1 tRNA pseudouridine synthase A-like [Thrips palmi]XP_034233681.1 tRNA pseudouridine synthase A-like [Thrips palmi]
MNPSKRQQEETFFGDVEPVKKARLPENENDGQEKLQACEEEASLPQNEEQKVCQEVTEQKIRRRKVVLLLSYSGWGYLGMQRNPDAKTIEGDLLLAMKNAGILSQEYYEKPQMMLFQRAARTDKGVSAVRQVVSLKIPEGTDIQAINEHLSPQIRVVCMKRTTKGFNSKVNCDARTYSYVLPTYAFAPPGEEPSESFRISKEIMERINQVLKNYVGTHNFHNFTFKKGFKDPSAIRFMHTFTCGEPFVRSDREYIILTVKGQSFMQHHIRKMIGLAIAVLRGYTVEETIQKAFKSDPLDIPKAPGLGLMLEEVHYDAYNKRYGSDGVHEKLDWTENESFLNEFKEKFILKNILKTEEEEKSMLTWMTTLPGHSYSLRENRPPTINKKQEPLVEEQHGKEIKTECNLAPTTNLVPETNQNENVTSE